MSTKLVRKLKLTRATSNKTPLSKIGRTSPTITAGKFDVSKWDTAKFGGAGVSGTRIEILDP